MRTPRALAAAAVLALTVAACDGDGDPEPDEPAAPEESDASDEGEDGEEGDDAAPGTEAVDREPAEVELLDPGAPPRERLRLGLEEGTEVTATLRFEEEILSGGADDEPQPPQAGVIGLRLEVTEVADDGTTTIAFAYEDVAIDDQDGRQRDPLEGVEGELVLDERSRLVRTSQTAQGLDELPTALPEEEVGVGARWEIRTEDVLELPATETTTVELTALDEDAYELELTASTQGPAEPTPMPGGGGQSGAELVLEELERDGSGRQRASTSSPLPISSRRSTHTLLVISLEDDDDDPATDLGGRQRQEFREEIVYERDGD